MNILTRSGKLILAFPGMGKSPLANKSRWQDIDFGIFREALNVPKEKEETILPMFVKFLEAMLKEGHWVMTNEPKLLKLVKFDRVYLPSRPDLSRASRKLGVDNDTIAKWVQDWALAAKNAKVPVVWISVGLDRYLS
jgi:hypothetical protein